MVESEKIFMSEIIGGVLDDPNVPEDQKRAVIERAFEEKRAMIEFNEMNPDSLSRAVAVHNEIDRRMKEHQEKNKKESDQIICKKGCSFCCHQVVRITADEADLLLKAVGELDWDKIKRQSKYKDSEWNSQPKEDKACVFLENNECFPYDYRPMACRQYFSVDDRGPSACDVEAAGHDVKRFVNLSCELFMGANWSAQENDTIPRMLLKRKEFHDRNNPGWLDHTREDTEREAEPPAGP